MGLEQASFLSQIVSAVAVVGSLIFVGIQVRHSTQVARAQIRESIMSAWSSVGQVITSNPRVFAAGIAGTGDSYSAFSNEDKFTFNTQAFVIFKHYENMFLQHTAGFLESEIWSAWQLHCLMYFHQPGIQAWWQERRMTYSPRFRAFLEASKPPAMVSQVEMFARRPQGEASG
jgi:hypothetical protein